MLKGHQLEEPNLKQYSNVYDNDDGFLSNSQDGVGASNEGGRHSQKLYKVDNMDTENTNNNDNASGDGVFGGDSAAEGDAQQQSHSRPSMGSN